MTCFISMAACAPTRSTTPTHQVEEKPQTRRRELKEDSRWPARGQRRRRGGRNVRCSRRLHGMSQRRSLRQRGVERRRRGADGCTQRTVQRMARGSHIIVTRHHQLHAAGAGTDEVHAVWVDDRRCHGHAHRQSKPHQHKAGELDGVAQALHAFDYVVSHRQTLVC